MSDLFNALAHPVRRDILRLLRQRAMSAGEIAVQFHLAKPTLSGHFSVLKIAGLITAERKGTTILYRLNMSVLEEAVAALVEITQPAKKRNASWKPAGR